MKRKLNSLADESWEGVRTIDYNKLFPLIAKDPPGFVRTMPVAPRYAPREHLANERLNRSARSNASSVNRLPPKPKTPLTN